MSRGDETIDNRVDHIMMRCKKFAAGRGDFDSNLVIRRHQRRPGRGQVGPTGRREKESIHHRVHNARICLVIFDRIRIVHRIDDGGSGSRPRALRKRRGDGAEKNKS